MAAAPRRQWPRWQDIRPMVVSPPRTGTRLERRLARAGSIEDLCAMARRRAPRAVFDYVDGAAEGELSLARARAALDSVEFSPHVLRDVAAVETRTEILGEPAGLPLVLAPTGLSKAVHHEAEPAVARAAADAGLPYALSTMSTTSIEDVAAAAPAGNHWFQLYVWRDRAASTDLLARAAASGFSALILTVDVPVSGARLRDVRNGFTVPPTLRAKTLFDMGLHPAWWFNLLTGGPLGFASMGGAPSDVAGQVAAMFDPSVTFDDIAWVREHWSGPMVIKGIQRTDDAVRAADLGADALVVSNHGGRQLDRSRAPLVVLQEIRDRMQDRVELYLDGGIRSGADIAAAVGLGADACLAGRAYLYGLMAGGEVGVRRALSLLRAELVRTMQLLGVRDLAELRSGVVRLPTGSAGWG